MLLGDVHNRVHYIYFILIHTHSWGYLITHRFLQNYQLAQRPWSSLSIIYFPQKVNNKEYAASIEKSLQKSEKSFSLNK